MKINVFIKNTAVLVVTALILRSVGIIFKIHLANLIGSEGMGLYQQIFSVYILVSAFATSGISTAVTRLVSEVCEDRQKVTVIMKKATVLTLALSVFSAVLMLLSADFIAIKFIGDQRSAPSLKILTFSLPFMGLSSCMRGYFLARRKTLEPSLVQLLEQAVRISVILMLLSRFSGYGLTFSAAAVLIGDVVAEAVSFLTNYIIYKCSEKSPKRSSDQKGIYKKIISIALPITGSSYLSSFLHTAENLLVPAKLAFFYGTRERGLQLFGAIRSMAMPVLFFPASFLTSFSTMLIPEMSGAAANGKTLKIKNTVEKSVSITLTLSVFTACVFWFCAYDISTLLYNDTDVGFTIKILAPIVPFMYLESVSAGILKGLDRQKDMFWYNLFDSLLRIIFITILLPICGIKGYLAVMTVSNCLTSSLCFYCLLKTSGVSLKINEWIIKPLATGVFGGILAWFLFKNQENLLLRTSFMIFLQVAVFLLFFAKKFKALRNL